MLLRFWPLLAGGMAAVLVGAFLPDSWVYVEPEKTITRVEERFACPMLCVITTHDGICPQCGMDMEKIDESDVIAPEQARMIGLEVARVRRLPLLRQLRTVGRIELDQSRVSHVTAWVPGRIVRLFREVVGEQIRKGDPLMEIFSPRLYTAQEEHLANLRTLEGLPRESPVLGDLERVARLSRDRLVLLGLSKEQIDEIEKNGASVNTLIHSPMTGILLKQEADEGQYVTEGTMLLEIADLEVLWLYLDIFEMDLPLVRSGQRVRISTRANQGLETWGVVDLVEPSVDPRTRTTRVRVTLSNPVTREGRQARRLFSPGMFADVEIQVELSDRGLPAKPGAGAPVISVPMKAVLDSGIRTVVYLLKGRSEGGMTFALQEVVLGPEGQSEDGSRFRVVLEGLSVGQFVATSGNFLLDSQAQLRGHPSLFFPGGR